LTTFRKRRGAEEVTDKVAQGTGQETQKVAVGIGEKLIGRSIVEKG